MILIFATPEETRELLGPSTRQPEIVRPQTSGPCVHYDELSEHAADADPCTYPYGDGVCPHLDNPDIICPVKDACYAMSEVARMRGECEQEQGEQDAVPATPPSAEEQAAAAVAQCIKPPVDVEDIARQQHADKLKADLERLQADHDTRVARWAATAPDPAPSAPPTPEASTVATAPDAPQSAPTAPPKMGSGAVCEKCGAEVSDAQKNLSQLFTNKTLCKTCLEAP